MPILNTKLYAPPVQATTLYRSRLLARLNAGLHKKLTLISAPAGFGKTTLVSSWLAKSTQPVVWLSLDEQDKEPYRFVTYLLAAIQTQAAGFAAQLMASIQGPQPPELDTLGSLLLNEINNLESPLIVVLDDFHQAQSAALQPLLAQCLDYLPQQVRFVVTTREEPSLAIATLRAKGELSEFRLADLRFNSEETLCFLNEAMQLDLPPDAIERLEQSTEGWITGLQLAALALQGQANQPELIQQFQRGHHFVTDYLLHDVLLKQPQPIQHFLLLTSVLERFCAPLCDALLRTDDGTPRQCSQEALAWLEKHNLFIIPLDAEKYWFRYHHLFAELIRRHLQRTEPDCVERLHQQASDWFIEAGFELEAFHHATAAHDYGRAVSVINSGIMPWQFRGGVFPILHWVAQLPPEILNQHPDLWITWASCLLVIGQVAGVEDMVQAAEHALELAPQQQEHYADRMGRIASIRASVAVTRHDFSAILVQADIALQHLHPNNDSVRASVTWAQGYAYFLQGNRILARQSLEASLQLCDRLHHTTIGTMCRIGLAEIFLGENQLHRAVQLCEAAIERAGDTPPNPICDAYLGLARTQYQWCNLDKALEYAETALPFAQRIKHTDRALKCELFLARLAIAKHDLASAEAILSRTQQAALQPAFQLQRPEWLHLKIRLCGKQNNWAEAQHWAEQHPQPIQRLYTHLAQNQIAEANNVAQRCTLPALPFQQFEYHLLTAWLQHAKGEDDAIQSALKQLIELAMPEQMMQIFIDFDGPLTDILRHVDDLDDDTARQQFIQSVRWVARRNGTQQATLTSTAADSDLITPREREVLLLIAQGLSNQEISIRLHRALSTIKGHNQSIFDKLQVQRRTEAVAKARELGLL